MKRIYVITTQTQTVVGKAIRMFTAKTYNHNSLSFDDSFETCYAIGRHVIHNPFSARLIREKFLAHPHYRNTNIIVSYIEVPEDDYYILKERVELMFAQGDKYRYNYVGFLGYFVGKPIKHSPHRFNCSQFIGYAFDSIGIRISGKEPDALMPLDFVESPQFTTMYEGPLETFFVKA